MKYFNQPKSLQELRDQYKALCFQFHPDVSVRDTTADMQVINAEFDELSKELAKGQKYEESEIKFNDLYKEKIDVLIKLKGIQIEIIGNWIWVTGDTKPIKDVLKGLGFTFSPNKVAWYFKSYTYWKRGKEELSLGVIRSMYGSTKVSGSGEPDDNRALSY